MVVRLESLAFGGEAVGHADDGRVVLVARGAPGDRVRVRVTAEHKRWLRAEICEIVEAGADRVPPACPHFADCGACQWQHVGYEAQLRAKRAIVESALRRLGVTVEGPVPAMAPFGTRRRVRLLAQDGRVGYRAWRSRRFVPVETCPVLVPALWQAVRAAPPRGGEIVGLAGANAVGTGDDVVELAAPAEPSLRVPADVFAQASADGDSALAALVRDWAEAGGRRVIEIFAGAGNFTRWLIADGADVTAIEGDARAAEWLARNAAAAHAIRDDAARAVLALAEAGERFDVAVLDPPRAGCRELLPDLARLAPSRIVYVSCDPMTLGRDLERLAHLGWRTTRARCFDLVPQTSHVETVALAVRS
ncbi:MAG: RsmD family RNA methyltransferase [Myxococcota bacterium]